MTVIPFKLTQVTADAGTRSIGYKAPDGCKGDGTCVKRAPARGGLPIGWRRVNIVNRRMMVEGQAYAECPTAYTADALNQYAAAYAAGATAFAGQCGPQIAAPEEIFTVPLAGLIGGVVGGVLGAALGETVHEVVDEYTLEKGYAL